MKNILLFLFSFGFMFTIAGSNALAQNSQTYILDGPNFWLALLSGVVLAFVFQVLLASLSLAMGISMTPNIEKLFARHKAKPTDNADSFYESNEEDEDKESSRVYLKTVNGLGLWTVITSSIALFSATWIAVRFNFIALDASGILIGLIVWALFISLMIYLEVKSLRSLTGGLIGIVSSGLHMGADSIKSVFTRSEPDRVKNITRHAVHGIYEELVYLDRKKNIGHRIEKYLKNVSPEFPSYRKLKKDIKHLIESIKIEEKYDVSHDELTRELSVRLKKDHKHINRENAEKLHAAVDRAFDGAEKETSPAGKIGALMDVLLPINDNDVKKYRQQLAKTLRHTGREELDPDELMHDIEMIVAEPKTAGQVIKSRLALFDKNTVKSLLAEQKNLDRKKADKIVETVSDVIHNLSDKYSSDKKTSAAMHKKSASIKSKTAETPERVKLRITAWLDSLDRPELSYDEIKHDIEEILHDPKEAPHILKMRLSEMDRDTLLAILETNKHIPADRAEDLADDLINLRDSVLSNIDKLKTRATSRYENLCRKAVIQAEHARETIMAASWWLFIIAIISGIAAAGGGLIGAAPPLMY